MAKLIHTVEGSMYREYSLEKGKLTIGRDLDNDIQLDDDAVSSHHAEIAINPSIYMKGLLDVWALDLGSTNGTAVNGKKVKKHMLKHDDVVKVGTHQFKYVDEHAMAGIKTTRILLDEE